MDITRVLYAVQGKTFKYSLMVVTLPNVPSLEIFNLSRLESFVSIWVTAAE